MTSEGRFVNREEGLEIATQAGQIRTMSTAIDIVRLAADHFHVGYGVEDIRGDNGIEVPPSGPSMAGCVGCGSRAIEATMRLTEGGLLCPDCQSPAGLTPPTRLLDCGFGVMAVTAEDEAAFARM